jgi:hypothetical protein
MKFANNKTCININRGYNNKRIEAGITKFLGLQIDNNLTEKSTLNALYPASSACFAMRTVMLLWKIRHLQFAYFHSIMSYGVTFWENSKESKRVLNIQKKITLEQWHVSKKSLADTYFRNVMYFPLQVNSFSHYYHSLRTTWIRFKY